VLHREYHCKVQGMEVSLIQKWDRFRRFLFHHSNHDGTLIFLFVLLISEKYRKMVEWPEKLIESRCSIEAISILDEKE
jgi:hypothetical protein